MLMTTTANIRIEAKLQTVGIQMQVSQIIMLKDGFS